MDQRYLKPKLAIHLDTPASADETWWIRFVGLYNGNDYTDCFAPGTNEAAITEPDPGSYLVTVASSKGYVCVREVDFVEHTQTWTFHRELFVRL